MNIKTLELYQSIRESMTELTVDGAFLHGYIPFNATMINSLKELSKAGLCSATFRVYDDDSFKFELTVGSDITDKHYGAGNLAKIEINKQSNQNRDYFICNSWKDLIEYTDYLLHPVKYVYFGEQNKILGSESGDKRFDSYIKLSKICNLVKEVSHSTKGNTFTILYGQPLDIAIILNESALDADIDIGFLDELLGRDQHREAMFSLVREALYNLLSDLDCKSRLSHLVSHFNAFVGKLLVSYEQYVRNYSFDKVRKEYQEKATEYIAKINKVFDDVATKTFSIPLGVWFATSKMETTTSIESLQFLKNISYSFMVAFLVIVVLINLLGQFSTLSSTVDEYTGLFERLESKLDSSQKSELGKLKQTLDSRNITIFYKLLFTIILSLLLMGFTIFVTVKSFSPT